MSKFEHSVPVPHLYKRVAKIIKEVKENGASLKTLVYTDKRLKEIKPIYALAAESLQHSQHLDFLLKRTQLLEKEPRFDPWLAKVLITELFWGKGRLRGESKPVKTLLAYQQVLNAHINDIYEAEQRERKVIKPRYVRVNSLKISTSKAIALFKDEGWNYVECDKEDYEGFLQRVANLGKEEFMSDIHIEDLLIFPPGTKFHKHEAYLKGSIVLQDKASCLPVHVLNPPPNATVLDMCAAPGMKTSHLAAKMNNKGLIYAVDMDATRFEALERLMKRLGVTCVKTINKDVLAVKEKDCPGIEYILVDPSCSGSGIVDRLDFDYPQTQTTEERLKKLAGFQILMLKHALRRFPNAKRVVYSTCSINPEENEAVVQEVLNNCKYFKLVPADSVLKSRWLNFGSPKFVEIGKNCLYAKPEVDQTNGFFVAIFERTANYNNEVVDVTTEQNEIKKKRGKKFEAGDVPGKKGNKNNANGRKSATGDVEEEIKNSADDKLESKRRKRKHSEAIGLNGENEGIGEQRPNKFVKIEEGEEVNSPIKEENVDGDAKTNEENEEIEEQKPNKFVKIEEGQEENNDGSFNKTERVEATREAMKRRKHEYLGVNSQIKKENSDDDGENEEIEEQKPEIVKIEEGAEVMNNGSLNKTERVGAVRETKKRNKHKYLDVNSPIKEENADGDARSESEKKELKKPGGIKATEKVTFEAANILESFDTERIKLEHFAIITDEDTEVPNQNQNYEVKTEKRKKKKKIESRVDDEEMNNSIAEKNHINPQVSEWKLKKVKNRQWYPRQEMLSFGNDHEEENENQKRIKRNAIVVEDKAVENNLSNSNTKRRKHSAYSAYEDNEETNKQKRKKKKESIADYEEIKIREEASKINHVEERKHNKQKKVKVCVGEETNNLETVSPFDLKNKKEDQKKKKKKIITAGQDEGIGNNLDGFGTKTKKLNTDEVYSNNEEEEEEEENTSYQIEKLKRKKRKKIKSVGDIELIQEEDINLQFDDQNQKKNKQIVVVGGENEEVTNYRRTQSPSAKRKKLEKEKQGSPVDDGEGRTSKKKKTINAVITTQ